MRVMLVWLDDVRPAPEGWEWVKTEEEAIEILKTGRVEYLSLDHDLGFGGSGYSVACFIEKSAFRGLLRPFRWDVHSQNPVGRERMVNAMLNADKFWGEKCY